MRQRRVFPLGLALVLLAGAAGAADVPRKSPEFAIDTNAGRQILLSQYRGKIVPLVFILTTCPHCQHTVQILTKLQNEYGPKGVQVLASAIEDNASLAVPDFIKRFQPSFPVGFNNRAQVHEYLQHPVMLRMMMPQIIFVDRQGTIRAQYAGDTPFFGTDQEKNLRAQIESLLKESPPAKSTAAQKKNGSSKPARKKAT